MKEIDIFTLNENIFKIVGKDSAILTAGCINNFNPMTVSWATLGVLWERNVVICYVRPSRHTFSFIENNNVFTLSFFEDNYKDKLLYIGTHSGRDEDKIKKCNLTPKEAKENGVYYEESRLTFVCKKIYFQTLDKDQIPEHIKERFYPNNDIHHFYVGEIIQCLEKEI